MITSLFCWPQSCKLNANIHEIILKFASVCVCEEQKVNKKRTEKLKQGNKWIVILAYIQSMWAEKLWSIGGILK